MAALGEVEPEIRAALVEQRFLAELAALTERLRQAELRDYRPALLDDFEPAVPEAPPGPTSITPAAARAAQQVVDLVPKPRDRGLR